MSVLWGLHSPQQLQKIMEMLVTDLKAHKDGQLDTDAIKKLAGIGSGGRHSNNCWRDLKNMLPKVNLAKLHKLFLPIKHTSLGKIKQWVPMLYPHELLAGIFNHYPHMWDKVLYGGRETCQRFWSSVRGSPQFAQHPVKDVEGFESYCIPLKVHGDGTPVTGMGKSWAKMVDIF